MRKFILLSLILGLYGCAGFKVIERDQSTITLCCTNIFCDSDDFQQRAIASCGPTASPTSTFLRSDGATITGGNAFSPGLNVSNVERQCVKFTCAVNSDRKVVN